MSKASVAKLPGTLRAYATFVRSGDHVGWRCCTAPAVVIAPPADPPPSPRGQHVDVDVGLVHVVAQRQHGAILLMPRT